MAAVASEQFREPVSPATAFGRPLPPSVFAARFYLVVFCAYCNPWLPAGSEDGQRSRAVGLLPDRLPRATTAIRDARMAHLSGNPRIGSITCLRSEWQDQEEKPA